MRQYQHYIPRFLLQRFCSYSGQIRTYDIIYKYIGAMPISHIYGAYNMYKDNSDKHNPMTIEQGLSKLEGRAGKIVKQFCEEDIIMLKREQLIDFTRFLYVMSYRNEKRQSQYMGKQFDNIARLSIEKHMKYHHITRLQDVWLHNLKWLVLTDAHKIQSVLDEYNPNQLLPNTIIHETELSEFWAYNYLFYMCIWEAEDGCEFIITDNSFGCFEGVLMRHFFFPLSPKCMIVLVHKSNDKLEHRPIFSSITDELSPKISYFESSSEPNFHDTFTFAKIKVSTNDVYMVNAILLDYASKYISYYNSGYLYNSICFYENNLDKIGSSSEEKKDYSSLKTLLLDNILLDNIVPQGLCDWSI